MGIHHQMMRGTGRRAIAALSAIAVMGIASIAYATATSTNETVGTSASDIASSSLIVTTLASSSPATTAATTTSTQGADASTNISDANSSLPTSTTTDSFASATSTGDSVTMTTEQTIATSSQALVSVNLKCDSAYTGPLYDTPSGHLDQGYYLNELPTSATTTITGTVARLIGTQSWVICADKRGNKHEIVISSDTYSALSAPDGAMPQETVMEPTAQAGLDSF